MFLKAKGNYDAAETLLRKAVNITNAALGANDSDSKEAITNLEAFIQEITKDV